MKWYTQYLQVYEKPINEIPEDLFENIKQSLINKRAEKPLISVVLIAHNEETHLLSCIWSLLDNSCRLPVEIITINNNSTDHTEELLKRLGATYYNESQKGPGYARQCGLNHCKGKLHLCIDADTIYPPHYLETHINALMKPGVVGTFSLWSFMADNQHSQLGLWIYETMRDIYLRIQAINRSELCVRGMAFGFYTELGKKIGFRTDLIRGEDGSLALAMKQYGKLVFITSRKARVVTSNGTINSKGSLWINFQKHIIEGVKGITALFSKKEKYEDEESNIIK